MRTARLTAGAAAAPSAGRIPEHVLLVAHGSADARASGTVHAIAAAVGRARPGLVVRPAFLDHTAPRPEQVLTDFAAEGVPAVAMVPLLLTAAYHRRVDLPAVLARVEGRTPPVRITEVLGPAGPVPPLLLAGLLRRLGEAAGRGHRPGHRYDAVVLASAGTRLGDARRSVEQVAAALGTALGVPARAAYASGAGPTPAAAVTALRERGATRVAMAAYFVATGRLYRAAAAAARSAGASAVAAPLADAPELAGLVLSRLDGASGPAASGSADPRLIGV